MTKKPNIRFKGFDQEWEEKPFSETYTSASEGGTPTTSVKEYYEGGKFPFVKIEDTEQKYIYDTNAHITQEGIDHSSAWLVPKDNIIFTNGATIGNVAINKIPVTTKQGILGVVADKNKFDLEYLYYALSTDNFQTEVQRRQSKGTFATIILNNLNKILVPHTDPAEQSKIGEFFKALDELIGAKEEELEKLRQLKAALLEQMFPSSESDNPNRGGYNCLNNNYLDKFDMVISSAPNTPRIRFKGFSGPWKKKLLKEVTINPSTRIENGILNRHTYISTENLLQNFKGVQDAESVPKNYSSIEYCCNDILMANIRPYLKKIWLSDRDGGCSPDVIIFRVEKGENVPAFIYYSLANDKFIGYVMDGAQGVKMPRGNKTLMDLYNIFIPTYAEQQRIGEFFLKQDEAIHASADNINKLKTIKQALLGKMFAA